MNYFLHFLIFAGCMCVVFQQGGVFVCLCVVTDQFVTFYTLDFLLGQEAPAVP